MWRYCNEAIVIYLFISHNLQHIVWWSTIHTNCFPTSHMVLNRIGISDSCRIFITHKMFFHRLLLYMKPHVFVHRNIITNWWRIESRVRLLIIRSRVWCPPEPTECHSCCNSRMHWNVQHCASITRNKSGRSKSISNRYSTRPDTACRAQIPKLLWQDD